MTEIVQPGESYDMAHARRANELGHNIKFEYRAMCINIPRCTKCKKAGWAYLEKKCGVE